MKINKPTIKCDMCGSTITDESKAESFVIGDHSFEDTCPKCRERVENLVKNIANPPTRNRAPKDDGSVADPTL